MWIRTNKARRSATSPFEAALLVMNPLVTSLPLLVLFSEIADACFAFGCYGRLGCAPPCLFGMCVPPCIGGGCFAARARAARTYKDDAGVVHTVTTQEPDEHFSTCCSLLDVPESCRHMCTFEGYNTSAIQSSLTFSFPCPATALAQIQFCAARGEDHSQCCQAAGISSQCLVFCDQRPDQTNELSFSHLQCLERFESMKDCFVEHAITEYYREKQGALDSLEKNQLLL